MLLSITPLSLLLLAGFCLSDDHFGYDGDDGPSHWGETFEQCNGEQQSPIDIDKSKAESVTLPPLKLFVVKNLSRMTMVNNGHTIMLKCNESNQAMVTGGPLGDNTYVFEQLHFHWGQNNNEGSETTINNQSFTMEMHAVFYNQKYESMDKALNYKDGLTVLGYFYEVSRWPNLALKPIVKALPEVQVPDKEVVLPKLPLLLHLLASEPYISQNYFTYNGSLTTPPCLEIVTWIVFPKTQLLSDKQVEAFRNVQTHDGKKMTHNFRPPQPLNGRTVLQNIPGKQNSGHGNKTPFPLITLQTLLGLFLLAV